MTYREMAYVYDLFMDDAPYDKWVSFAEALINKVDFPVKNIADLGCGTGEITIKLAEKGYTMTGVDLSVEMLAKAEQKAREKQQPVQFLQQDLRALEGLNNIDVAISFCDVINYIISRQDIKQVFRNVWEALSDGGLFIFDVHSLNHVENNLVNETFADVTDEHSYIWFCEAGNESGEMFHELTFFFKNEDKYERFDESHHQKTLSINDYEQYLEEAGFQIKGIYADFSLEKNDVQSDSERIFFFAEKQSG